LKNYEFFKYISVFILEHLTSSYSSEYLVMALVFIHQEVVQRSHFSLKINIELTCNHLLNYFQRILAKLNIRGEQPV